jgi:hypothetical protein
VQQAGQAPLSDLQCTTSSEALLAGKAPTFRLLVWAIDANGVPLPNVTYVVSESFVVATKRVKHAIKSDIPSIGDHVSKLVHIGKATVDKLLDLRQAAAEEGVSIDLLPAQLNRVDKVRSSSSSSSRACAHCAAPQCTQGYVIRCHQHGIGACLCAAVRACVCVCLCVSMHALMMSVCSFPLQAHSHLHCNPRPLLLLQYNISPPPNKLHTTPFLPPNKETTHHTSHNPNRWAPSDSLWN